MKKYTVGMFLFLGNVMFYSYSEEMLMKNNNHCQNQEKDVLISEIKSLEDSIKSMKLKETNFKRDIDAAQKALDDRNSEIRSQELELLKMTKEFECLKYAKKKKEHEEIMANLQRELESINSQMKEKDEKGILICNKIKEIQLMSKANKEDFNELKEDQSYNCGNNNFDNNTF